MILTLIAFWPSLGNGFTTWDDNVALLDNALVKEYSWPKSFFQFERGLYHPLVTLSYALEFHCAGLAPFVYHLDNLLLHLANTLLAFCLILMLGGSLPAAGLTALLFVVHPTRVEAVAWVTERKEVLYVFFYLLALLSYLRLSGERTRQLCATGIFFFFSLLAKVSAVSLPLILLLLDWRRGQKIDRDNLLSKLPFFLLALLFGVLAIAARLLTGSLTSDPPFSLSNIIIGSYRFLHYYVARLLLPFCDAALYPSATYAAKTFAGFPLVFWLSPPLLIALLGAFIYLTREKKEVLFGGLFFLFAIFPSLWLIPVGYSADRFTYLPAIGIFYLAALGLTALGEKLSRSGRRLLIAGAVIVILSLSLMTWQRCGVWRDGVSLWSDAVARYPLAAEPYNCRALAYSARGDDRAALRDWRRALEIDPNNAGIFANLSDFYYQRGAEHQARVCLEQALRLKPDDRVLRHNLDIILKPRGNSGRIKP